MLISSSLVPIATNTNNKRKSDQLSKVITTNLLDQNKKGGNNLFYFILLYNQKNEAMKPRKRGRPRNPTEAPFFTQAIVRNALLEGKIDQVG